MSVMDIARKEDRKSKKGFKKIEPVKGIRGATRATLELGVQSAVVSTLAPGAAAGVSQVYGAGIPLVTLKGLTDELTEGGAVSNFDVLVVKEMKEHTWLTREQAEQVVREHAAGNDSIVGTSKKISDKYGSTAFMYEMKCDACGTVFPPGTKFRVLNAQLGAVIAYPTCPGTVNAK